MSGRKKFIFVSSSSDIAESRKAIASELQAWLSRQGLSQDVAPYLWEDETDRGRMLVDRMPIQSQLIDPFETFSTVPFVICLFGERCGVPLEDDLYNPDWERRIAPWRAGADGRGLIHPWPKDQPEQDRVLDMGGFPLTGTVFELISACEADPDKDNLVIGYIATRYVDRNTTIDQVFFNRKRERNRLLLDARNPAEETQILNENYKPQIRALINLLAFFGEKYAAPRIYETEEELRRDVVKRAQTKLRQRYGLASSRNPFKTTLEHWTINDEHDLPGRNDKVRQVLEAVEKNETRKNGAFILIKGASGCGKSSLLHRGVLAPLANSGVIVIALRPTDIESAASNADHVDVLWARICEQVGGCPSRPPSRHMRDEWMAKSLLAVLEDQNKRLVIGLDQFEEVLDELSLFTAKKYRTTRWWLVLRFLGRLAGSRRVQLIGTLETTRWKTFEVLEIEKALNLSRVTIDAEVSPDDAARIAQTGFQSVGINLEEDVVQEIKTQWDTLQDHQSRHGQSASPLPLACLRFAKLFEKFEDVIQVKVVERTDETASDFAKASEDVNLGLEQIGGPDAIAFDSLIADLAEEAWSATGQKKMVGWPIDEDPDLCNTLSNFLDPLIGVDSDGHKRLLAATHKGADATTDALRASFHRVRLLVPAGKAASSDGGADGEPLLRVVHQALVDRWEPARLWFEWRKSYLEIEDQMRLKAKAWAVGGRKHVRASKSSIQHAAQVLHGNKIAWVFNGARDIGSDAELRDFAMMLFGQASEPGRLVDESISGTTFAYVAVCFHMTDLLEKFWKLDKSIVELRDKRGRDPFSVAAWCDGPAIPWLFSKKAEPSPDKLGWHPVAAAIQVNATSNYESLVGRLNDLTEPIGPEGFTLLGEAARYGNCQVIEDLLKRGCETAASLDEAGRSPLMWAALSGEVEAFRLLLPVSDVELVTSDQFEYTALQYAAQQGQVEIIRAMLDDDRVDEAALERLLAKRDAFGRTPLMLASTFKHAEAVRALLSVCDPRDGIHRQGDGATLFHSAVSGQPVYEEEKLRARRTVEILLEDGRLAPDIPNDQGKTAFELATQFPEVRRILRQNMSISYADMNEAMRRDDLRSANPNDALRLIREEPKALTETHEGQSGLDILLDGGKLSVLAAALHEGLVTDELLRQQLPRFANLAGGKRAREFRVALVNRISRPEADLPELAVLLNSVILDEDNGAIEKLLALGTTTVKGTGRIGASLFHELAIKGQMGQFEEIAARYRLALPVDGWGRRPSELAADHNVTQLRKLEDRLFASPAQEESVVPRATKFHDCARNGDLRGFERQARGVTMTIPLDDEGRKPSDVAPEDSRDRIAELEVEYFVRSN